MKKLLIILVIVVAVIGLALPYAPVDFLKGPLEHALSRGLGRKVDVDRVAFTLFSGPGFSLDGVTIHEDPRAGIEPFVYANTLDARLNPLALLGGRLEFTSLDLNDATFNLVKPDDATWNFQMLFGQKSASSLPALKMRGGRVNFKFGQTKSVVFFDDTDLDVSPSGNGGMALRFSGVPARTDRSLQNFGHFFVRGNSSPSGSANRLNLRVELEPSSLDSIARLFAQSGVDLKGMVSLDAQVSGETNHLDVFGIGQLEAGGQWGLQYKGVLDLAGQTLALETSGPLTNAPVKVRVSARQLLSRPEWDLSAALNEAPLAPAVDVARKLGVPLPAKLAVQGSADGTLRYRNTDGFGGNLELSDIVVTQPDATPLKAATATVFLKGDTILVGPVTVGFGSDSAELEAAYQTGEEGGLQAKINTHRMNVADLRAYGLGSGPLPVPMIDRALDGTLRGALRYERPADGQPSWSGDFELQNTQLAIDGVSDPVRILSAAVSAKPDRITVMRIRGKAGIIDFSGDCGWDADGAKPYSFRLRVEEADINEVERLLHPAMAREAGLFARTLGIGSNEAVPDWLAKRQAEGTLAVRSLTAAGTKVSAAGVLVWNGAVVKMSKIQGKIADATLAGDLQVDLTARTPAYTFTGTLAGVPYKGGKLDFDGTLESAGSGVALLSGVHAAGKVQGRALALLPDGEYRRAAGHFALSMTPAGPVWKLSELELSQGSQTFAGEGTLEANGKLALDLHRN